MDNTGPIIVSMWRQEWWSPEAREAEAAQAAKDAEATEAADRAQRLLDAKAEQEAEEDKDDEAMYWTLRPEIRLRFDVMYGPTTRRISLAEARQRLRRKNHEIGRYGPEKRRPRGCLFPKRFIPPTKSIMPLDLFSGANRSNSDAPRQVLQWFCRRNDANSVLVFADGACLDNGLTNPKAGWAVHHGPGGTPEWPCLWLDRLESKGPFGHPGAQTSNRAELRAVIAAMRCASWTIHGYYELVIATDSKYVTEGVTKWAKSWMRNEWKTREGEPVANKDLWQLLLGDVERLAEGGVHVELWKIPREWNTYADNAAKVAAAWETVPSEWMDF